jgi:hypothetical protein
MFLCALTTRIVRQFLLRRNLNGAAIGKDRSPSASRRASLPCDGNFNLDLQFCCAPL